MTYIPQDKTSFNPAFELESMLTQICTCTVMTVCLRVCVHLCACVGMGSEMGRFQAKAIAITK